MSSLRPIRKCSSWFIRNRFAQIVGRVGMAGAFLAILQTSMLTAQDPAVPADVRVEQAIFAPGVIRVIPPAPHPDETFDGPLTLKSLLDTHPEITFGGDSHPEGEPFYTPPSRTLVEMAREAILRRQIYCFEFAFKPLRHVYIDLPGSTGRMKRKLIWYMVYRVRYTGGDLQPADEQVAGVTLPTRLESVHYKERRFFPSLVLRDHVKNESYLDKVLPSAENKIRIREQISAKVLNSADMTRVKIPYTNDPAGEGVWGVATWEDVDPDIDFLSVEIAGLTNAFEVDGEGLDAPYRRKVLQLNFYRPGDALNQTADEIRFGVPAYADANEQSYILKQYGLDERLDYRWIFR
ncbi:MAG: hypothetical protein AAF664_03220 [Planctomycetota bacterium]